ncbi:hypothetical protein SAMN05216319_4884 [Duganella sp. CF402]|uniref:hypothetical protein n=1 Tax=unclassified Duganella TaxID=2636909 RepID=UPI0008B61F7A|nr:MULTISPECIES: hypothetical protein [unclassified Duganella]RZT05820.1 hypothetical protein EV582_4139 [Duganella sp. BK701]SEM90101.1 hypothetical protein SAMN05216319_4884 [Duganella sp. CF402]
MRYLAILLAGVLSACAQTTPHWDARFGFDTRMVLAQQIMHPEAARNADPVAGMDGRSARAAYERYQKAGAEQQPAAMSSGAK